MSGCRGTRVTESRQLVIYDSVTVIETLRDTVVKIQADTSLVRALLECDSLGRVRIAAITEYYGGRNLAPPSVKINDNRLTAVAVADSMEIYLQLRDRYERHQTRQDDSRVVTLEANRPGRWQKFWMRTGKILSGAIVLIVLLAIRKR